MRPSALGLLALAAAAATAGCFDPYGFRNYTPDARPTPGSGQVLAGYDDARANPRAGESRAADELMRDLHHRRPNQPPPGVPKAPPELTLPVERPWTGPPRTVMTGELSSPPDAQGAHEPRSPAPAGEAIAAGDDLEVQVARHPEFNGCWQVDPQGRLRIPPGGAFGPGLLSPTEFSRRVESVTGWSPAALAAALAREFGPYLKTPPEVKVTIGKKAGG